MFELANYANIMNFSDWIKVDWVFFCLLLNRRKHIVFCDKIQLVFNGFCCNSFFFIHFFVFNVQWKSEHKFLYDSCSLWFQQKHHLSSVTFSFVSLCESLKLSWPFKQRGKVFYWHEQKNSLFNLKCSLKQSWNDDVQL